MIKIDGFDTRDILITDTKKSSSDITTTDAVAGNFFFESTGSGYELTSQNPAYIEGDTSVVDESNQGTPGR